MRKILFLIPQCLFFLIISCNKNGENSIKPTLGTITESVYASGVVKAEGQYTIYPAVNGVLKDINVKVGQSLDQGQPLFVIDNEKALLSTENARLAYQLSQENNRYVLDKISEMEARVQAAKDRLALDKSVYERNKNIKQYNVISEVEYERVELAYKNSKSNYEASVKQLSQLKTQLLNEQNRNNINLKINQKSENDFIVKSEFSGELFDVIVKKGALVSPQTPLAIIGKINAYVLELEVDENDMVKVILGQKMEVTLDSYKGKVFEAIINKIYPIMDERSRTFKIEAHYVKTPIKLYPNLTAEANIIIKTKKNALTIPKSYLIEDEYVMVNEDKKRKVKIGLSDYKNVEILDGLSAEEIIYKPK